MTPGYTITEEEVANSAPLPKYRCFGQISACQTIDGCPDALRCKQDEEARGRVLRVCSDLLTRRTWAISEVPV